MATLTEDMVAALAASGLPLSASNPALSIGELIATKDIASADVLTMGDVPVEIVPGVEGFMLLPVWAVAIYKYVSAAYVTTDIGDLALGPLAQSAGATIKVTPGSALLGTTADAYLTSSGTPGDVGIALDATAVGQPIQAAFAANPSAGDGTLRIITIYRRIPVVS